MVFLRQRLMEERKLFRKNRAFGFAASPMTLPDGTQVPPLAYVPRPPLTIRAEFDDVGMPHPGQRRHAVGRRVVSPHNNFL
jgi:hypothetical protein